MQKLAWHAFVGYHWWIDFQGDIERHPAETVTKWAMPLSPSKKTQSSRKTAIGYHGWLVTSSSSSWQQQRIFRLIITCCHLECAILSQVGNITNHWCQLVKLTPALWWSIVHPKVSGRNTNCSLPSRQSVLDWKEISDQSVELLLSNLISSFKIQDGGGPSVFLPFGHFWVNNTSPQCGMGTDKIVTSAKEVMFWDRGIRPRYRCLNSGDDPEHAWNLYWVSDPIALTEICALRVLFWFFLIGHLFCIWGHSFLGYTLPLRVTWTCPKHDMTCVMKISDSDCH